jgi:hypothetical protein
MDRKAVEYVESIGTLKALSNFSPGFAWKPWEQECGRRLFATMKELRRLRFTDLQSNFFRPLVEFRPGVRLYVKAGHPTSPAMWPARCGELLFFPAPEQATKSLAVAN